MTTKKTDRPTTPVDDPAVVAAKEAQEAAAAYSAYAKAHPTLADEQTPEYKAIKERSEKADDAFADAPVASVAGVLTKLRALEKDIVEDSGPSSWEVRHIKTVLTFLEGFAAVEPDPLVTLFAEWRAIQDEDMALDKADVTRVDPHIGKKRVKLYERQSAIEQRILETGAASVSGIAVKLRLMYHIQYPGQTVVEGWHESTLCWEDDLLLGALLDAERLAGVSLGPAFGRAPFYV